MARHLMAVCVVCLLCAEHLPCKQHYDEHLKDPEVLQQSEDFTKQYNYIDNIRVSNLDNTYTTSLPNKRRGRTKDTPNTANLPSDQRNNRFSNVVATNHFRTKRHMDETPNHHSQQNNHNQQPSQIFIKKLFEQFGNVATQTMNVVEFERMLNQLGLYSLLDPQHKVTPSAENYDETCISGIDFIKRMSSSSLQQPAVMMQNDDLNPPTKPILSGFESGKSSSNGDTVPPINLASSTTPTSTSSIKDQLYLNSNNLMAICPILLYHITANTSKERSGCINSNLIPADFYTNNDNANSNEVFDGANDRALVWIYATISILIASLCGLLAVAVIPCMDKEYYHYLLQFFVALGVGTLAGDALLHLLPHAMTTFSKNEDPHVSMTLKGLVAAIGIVFFFLTERALTMIAEWRKRIQKKEKPSSRVRVMRDPDTISVQHPATEKLCKAKYSSYPYCYDEIDLETRDDHHHHNREAVPGKCPPSPTAASLCTTENMNHHHKNYKNHEHNDFLDTAQSLLSGQNNYTISDSYVALRAAKDENNVADTNTISTNVDNGSVESRKSMNLAPEENYTIILREHESKHHGHSHTHGHVHSPPSTLSAVAWMVIMGDGLHNFTDGMAIGAAFSNNIAGGFSTALAVFCHELPHELGDFAILLKAGMSAKQAVYYNVLSSVLSFIGAIIGISIGSTPEASAWIFACAAGMFLYIALVDMMPELTSSHKETFAFTQLLLQLLGISIGIGIMLLIAIYEHNLKLLFTSNDHSDQHHHHHHHND